MTQLSVKRGAQAEQLACDYLQQQGLILLERNFHSARGEIDLIMQDQQQYVFIEVRCRYNPLFGDSLETISRRKQERIICTARYYLHRHGLTQRAECRFDAVGIDGSQQIVWIKSAFELE